MRNCKYNRLYAYFPEDHTSFHPTFIPPYLIKVIVDLSSIDTLRHQRLYSIPRHLLRRQVGPAHSNTIDPDIQGIAGTTQVGFIELVLLGPAEGCVAEALLYDGVEPGQEEVETGALVRGLKEKEILKEKRHLLYN